MKETHVAVHAHTISLEQRLGIDAKKERVWCFTSWGATRGGKKNGTFWFGWKSLERRLAEEGDAAFPRTS